MGTDAVCRVLKQVRSQVHGADGLLTTQGLFKQLLRWASVDGMYA